MRKKWSEHKVGDFLHFMDTEELYEVIEMGGKGKNFHLKAKCFFGDNFGRIITLYKLDKEDE